MQKKTALIRQIKSLAGKKSLSHPILIMFLAALCIWAISLRPPTLISAMASALSDTYYTFNTKTPSSSLVFIDIDHESVKEFGRWPWSRDILAKGFSSLSKAKVIGLDIIFAEPTEAKKDAALAEALSGLPVIGGIFLNGPRLSSLGEDVYYHLLDSSLMQAGKASLLESDRLEAPVSPIRESIPLLAALNTLPDADQRFRHYPLAFWVGDLAIPNLGVQMARMALHEDLVFTDNGIFMGDRKIPADARGSIRLNFYRHDSYASMGFTRLMEDDFDPDTLKDKIVIVGVSEAGVSDLRATPVGQFPGPLMHLTFVANLEDGSIPAEIYGWKMAGVLFLFCLLWWPSLRMQIPWQRMSLYTLLFSGLYGAGLGGYLYGGVWLEIFYPGLWLMLAILTGEVHLFMESRAGSEALRSAFSSYLAPEVVESLIRNPEKLRLGGEARELTLLFTDLRGFTARSETMDAESMVKLLNAYFEPMTHAVFTYRGTLDKYIGDAIMAIYNAPMEDDDHAFHACLSAICMLRELEKFNAEHPEHEPLQMGIGINTGPAVVGNLGSSFRFSYTAIGDAVNVAARLESATKEVNQELVAEKNTGKDIPVDYADILLGESTYQAVKDRLPCTPLPPRPLKGKSGFLAIYSLRWREIKEALLEKHRAR
ncbi:adenylate/guanylate cyclase domain-containing protein [Desulfobotulus mexicanus]|uniref:Adenylate/guanylate cyclase domain-containing protein n=1 Tax=Desulfobotulus mexicanus TaxID=2586642 RepID=A0A5Q4VER5_9BACT|nr:adenylate/guanylate cyclase domain-containing protein [Desulfobotulus mexicanus]TYT75458.1 adenylate/guanylate cyclase domain-containing protein [Desulfobotulus mexicanus]